jgi:hypothetical protein
MLISITLYVEIASWVFAWINYQKMSDDPVQVNNAKRHILNLITAIIMTSTLLICFNLVTDAIHTAIGYVSDKTIKLDVFLSKMANEILSLIGVGIMTNLAFQYAKLG